MASEARPQHNHQTRQQSVKEWSDPKHDSRYVTRHELKSFFTIYDRAAAKVRGQETDRLEGTLLMALDALTKWKLAVAAWNALPFWRRWFTAFPIPLTPEVKRPEEVEGLTPEDADQQMPAPSTAPEPEPETPPEPVVEQPKALALEMPWRCIDCGTEGRHMVAGNDLHPLNPTCSHCGSANTTFTGGPQ